MGPVGKKNLKNQCLKLLFHGCSNKNEFLFDIAMKLMATEKLIIIKSQKY